MGLNQKKDKIDLSELFCDDFAPYKDGRIWTGAFESAFLNYREIYIPKGRYYIDKSIVIKSGTSVKADENAEIILIKGTKTLLLRNESVIDGSDSKIDENAPADSDISIIGGVWGEENEQRAGYGASGCFDDNDGMHGVSTCFLFSGVNNLTLKNLTFVKTAGFACQIGRVNGFTIENLRFVGCFADGLHVNGGVRNGTVRNLSGHTEDDLIALNAYDWDNSSINFGCIENLTVDGIYPVGGENAHKSFRIQPGVYPYKDGGTEDCYIKNLTVKNVSGITTFKMYLQTPAYTRFPERPVGVGRIENVTFENVCADTSSPVDRQPNYLNGDMVKGNFSTFEIGSNVYDIKFKNVRVTLNKEKYRNSYFMTVGPKSQFIPEKGLELFDPYVVCTADKIIYDGVYINGEKIDDLTPYLKEVAFNKLYPSEIPFGHGKILSVVKENIQ